jgi:hypothetical protein
MRKLEADSSTATKTTARPRVRKPSTPTLRDRLALLFNPNNVRDYELLELAGILGVHADDVWEALYYFSPEDFAAANYRVPHEEALFAGRLLAPPSLLAEVGPEDRRTVAVTLFINRQAVEAYRELHATYRKCQPVLWRARLSFEDFLSDEIDAGNLGGDFTPETILARRAVIEAKSHAPAGWGHDMSDEAANGPAKPGHYYEPIPEGGGWREIDVTSDEVAR